MIEQIRLKWLSVRRQSDNTGKEITWVEKNQDIMGDDVDDAMKDQGLQDKDWEDHKEYRRRLREGKE